MIYEGNIKEAVNVLRDICYIIPPMPIKDLSYNQEEKDYSKKAGENTTRITEKMAFKKAQDRSTLD